MIRTDEGAVCYRESLPRPAYAKLVHGLMQLVTRGKQADEMMEKPMKENSRPCMWGLWPIPQCQVLR